MMMKMIIYNDGHICVFLRFEFVDNHQIQVNKNIIIIEIEEDNGDDKI